MSRWIIPVLVLPGTVLVLMPLLIYRTDARHGPHRFSGGRSRVRFILAGDVVWNPWCCAVDLGDVNVLPFW